MSDNADNPNYRWAIVNGKFKKVYGEVEPPTESRLHLPPEPTPTQAEVNAAFGLADSDSPDYISLAEITETTPLDDALDKICTELGLEARPGGPSAYGWSTRSLLLACPYKYKRIYIDEALSGISSHGALEIGGLWHQLLAFVYLAKMPVENGGLAKPADYEWIKMRLLEEKVAAEVVMEAYRLFDAYRLYYESDYLEPLDVEVAAEDSDGNTCRYDLIARVLPNNDGVASGTWIVEHKTAARFDKATLEGWQNDGQIIQQQMIWSRMRLKRKYGELQGVMVNLISKTKIPNFRRITIPPQRWQLRAHAKDLRMWDAYEGFLRAANTWPRNRASCVGRYGLCALFSECAGDSKK